MSTCNAAHVPQDMKPFISTRPKTSNPVSLWVTNIYSLIPFLSHELQHTNKNHELILSYYCSYWGTTVAQWLRHCAANWKVTGSIPAGVSGFFIGKKSFRSHYGPGVDSASNINENHEYFLGVKAAGALRLTTYHHPVPLSQNLGT